MKSMLQNMIACALVAEFVLLLAQGESLMPCPDCEKMVSRRALMCPNCGCKGEVIAEEAARLAKAEEPPPPDDGILADFGDRKERATFDIRRPTTRRRPTADDREVGATIDIRRPTTGWRHSTTDSRLSSIGRRPTVGRRTSNVALTQNII